MQALITTSSLMLPCRAAYTPSRTGLDDAHREWHQSRLPGCVRVCEGGYALESAPAVHCVIVACGARPAGWGG